MSLGRQSYMPPSDFKIQSCSWRAIMRWERFCSRWEPSFKRNHISSRAECYMTHECIASMPLCMGRTQRLSFFLTSLIHFGFSGIQNTHDSVVKKRLLLVGNLLIPQVWRSLYRSPIGYFTAVGTGSLSTPPPES